MLSEKEKLENLLKTKNPTDEHQELLQLKYKTYQLEQENKELQSKLHLGNELPQAAPESSKTVDKSFREQIPVSPDHYKIPIAIINKRAEATAIKSESHKSVEKFQVVKNNEQNQNVLQQPIPMNGKSSTTTTTPTSVVKKENLNLVTPVKPQSTSTKFSARAKPPPKGMNITRFVVIITYNSLIASSRFSPYS